MQHKKARLDFLGIGAQKSGTTTLNAYLRSHPGIMLARHEKHFFDNEAQAWPEASYNDYHRDFFFDSHADHQHLIRGEITPIYLYWEPSLKRIHAYNPEIRLIVLLRNPIARAYSHWAMVSQRGEEVLCFSDAIRAEDERLASAPNRQHRVYSYMTRGLYHQQLQRMLRLFPANQIYIARAEQLFDDPNTILTDIHRFLGVAPQPPQNHEHQRIGTYSSSLSRDDWMYLYGKLIEDIEALEHLLNWDCSAWKRPWEGIQG